MPEVNLQSPAQPGVQQYLYITIFMNCVEGGEVVPNSISLFVSAGFTAGMVRGDPGGITARRTGQTEHRSQHFSACYDPKSGGGKEDEGGLCLAERCKKKNCGICGKNLQS